jgi:hypothetical protein
MNIIFAAHVFTIWVSTIIMDSALIMKKIKEYNIVDKNKVMLRSIRYSPTDQIYLFLIAPRDPGLPLHRTLNPLPQ